MPDLDSAPRDVMPPPVTPLGRCRLEHHPQTPCGLIDEVTAEIGLRSGDVLVVSWRIVGNLEGLRIPDSGERLDPERLWEHTCCEVFERPAGGEAYVEWNFSPTGQIARFEFSGYRRRRPPSSSAAARFSVAIESGELRAEAHVPLSRALGEGARISLTIVMEDAAGALSYWALRHPCERPNFHHPDGFALVWTLDPSPGFVDA
jgi:hypothetical protein